MKTLRNNNRGFTLIELLVVVAIIALLIVGVAPQLTKAIQKSKANTSSQNCKKIHTALYSYALDHGEAFPEGESTSNDAFRKLFVGNYIDDEMLFYMAGSAWHNSAPDKKPDGDEGTADSGFDKAVKSGENTYSYVNALSLANDTALPLVADGFSETVGVYARDPAKKGGIWRGQWAAWVNLGGSAKLSECDSDLKVKEKKGTSKVDIFSSEYFGDTDPKLLNPEG